ncbi:MAG: NADPH:quinone oxidoreductase family protein [Oryzihumus sp.]
MRAWQVGRLGEPADVMTLAEVSEPVVQPGHVLVDVAATALNFPDVLMARGEYQLRPSLPFVPGVEVCGRVVEVGEGVTGVAVGDRVVGTSAPPAGGLAERALMPAAAVFPAPESLDDAQAAALTIGYQTAYVGLVRRAGLTAGETLLVHAASGGVGSAAVQVGKALGARVIAVVGGTEKASAARDLGADMVVDRTAVDLVPALKEAAGRGGVDVVFDPVGGTAYEASTKVIAFEGRIVVVGFAGGTIPAPALNHALIKNYSILGLHWNLYLAREHSVVEEAHRQLTAWAAEGRIAPLVSERLPFEKAVDALTRLGQGRTTGRVVVLAPR